MREQLAQPALPVAAEGAGEKVRLDLGRGPRGQSTVHPVVETFVELVARHDPSASLSSLRARKSCAFDVPVARFNIAAISS